MHLGETVMVIVVTVVVFFAFTIVIWPIFQKWIKKYREMTSLLEEADPASFRASFREYVVRRTSVTGYIQDACPFRTEPFEDSFILERFEKLEVWGSRAAAESLLIVATLITIGMVYMESALIYLGGLREALPMLIYLTIMATLLLIFTFLTVLHMLRAYRMNRALAEKFAKESEG